MNKNKLNKIILSIACTTALFSIGASFSGPNTNAAKVNKYDADYAKVKSQVQRTSKYASAKLKDAKSDFDKSKLGKEAKANKKEFEQSQLAHRIKKNEKKAIKKVKTVDKKFNKTETGQAVNKYASRAKTFLQNEKVRYNS